MFQNTFTRLSHICPEVLHPSLNTAQFDRPGARPDRLPDLPPDTALFLSINRYERKKNLGLAVAALAALPPSVRARARLVMAGGYDSRVAENLEHRTELGRLVDELGVADRVTFLESPSDEEKIWLLQKVIIYFLTL